MATSTRESIRAVRSGLALGGFYVLLLASVLAWSLAYQYKATYTVDLGGLQDDAYVSGFHAKETNPQITYRWSRAESSITLPGVGNEPVLVSLTTSGARPAGLGDPPVVTATARGQSFAIQTQAQPVTSTLLVARGDPLDGDVRITLSSPTFSPPGDARDLGVIVDRVAVAPAGQGLRPVVVPPVGTVIAMLAGLVLCYLGGLVATRQRRVSLAFAVCLSAVAAVLIVTSRPELGLLAPELPSLCAWGVFLAFAGRLILDLTAGARSHGARLAAGMGSVAFALAFVLRFGGLTYPQFLTSDIMLHVHYVQSILRGDWVFPGYLPDGTPVPYPPALYVVLAPLGLLFGSGDQNLALLLKWSMSLLDAGTCLALAWAGFRLWGFRTGALAALVYAISLAPYPLFSAGNYSNLFGQAILNLALLGALAVLARGGQARRPMLAYAVLGAGFALTMLGHYGMMLATLGIMGVFTVWVAFETARGRRPSGGWPLVAALAGAGLVSFAAYYRFFTVEMWDQWSSVFRRLLGGNYVARPGSTPQAGGGSPTAETFFARMARKIAELLGPPAAITGVVGAALMGGPARPARALLWSWLIASAVFLLLDQALGDAIRWYYLAAVPIALLGGRYLALLFDRGRLAKTLVALCFAVLLAEWASSWIGDLIFTRYH